MSIEQFNIIRRMPLTKLILLPLFIRRDLASTYIFLQQFNKD